jgi:hypothetical protein
MDFFGACMFGVVMLLHVGMFVVAMILRYP